jgi:hypothetical protein
MIFNVLKNIEFTVEVEANEDDVIVTVHNADLEESFAILRITPDGVVEFNDGAVIEAGLETS